MTIFSAALLLFLVMDPFGNIPFFLTALKKVDASRQKKVIIRELFIALFILICSYFPGNIYWKFCRSPNRLSLLQVESFFFLSQLR